MNNPKDRIYIQQWLELKPYDKPTVTDGYYLKLCNEVKQAIVTNKQSFVFQMYLNNEAINILSCFLTSYFEDIITGTNIWNTFINHHTELYNKPLPFFNTDEYYEEETNPQDVCFLIWYFMNTVQQEKLIAPFNDFITETAERVMDAFDSAWDYAPENKLLKTFYTIDENETNFYIARNLIDTILFKTYLFYPDTLLDLQDAEMKIIEDSEDNENLLSFLNENRDYLVHKAHTRLLSLKGKKWAARILGKQHQLYNDYLDISPKIKGYFLYKGQDDKDIFIEHIASGKKFNLTKKSFDYPETLKKVDTIIYMGIVLWQNKWWFSGISFQTEFNADLVSDEKSSMKSRMTVNFMDYQEQNVNELLEKQFTAFKDFTGGAQIVFIGTDKVDDFIRNYTEYFNNTLKLSKKERKSSKQGTKEHDFLGGKNKLLDYSDISENALIFFNPESGIELGFNVNSAFPAPNNPFFNEDESEDHIMRLLLSEEISTGLAMYCIDNYKSDLAFFGTEKGKAYLADIDFLLRFWKKGAYFAIPSITFNGLT